MLFVVKKQLFPKRLFLNRKYNRLSCNMQIFQQNVKEKSINPLNCRTIPIDSIFKVRRGKFWVERDGKNYSAAYTKLRILYGKNQYVYVSPADESRFVAELQKINPSIAFSSERGVNP